MEDETNRWQMFFSVHKRLIVTLSSVIIVVAVAAVFWFTTKPPTMSQPVTAIQQPSTPVPTTPLVASLTNGAMVAPELANRHPVAVMIENAPPARPQTGLTSADIVYEAVTEGGITRFMAIYSQRLPIKAGPVRSARSYFIDWLSEYDAFYAHAGGSPTALARIGQYNIKDTANDGSAYHREPKAGLASEHTLYVDVAAVEGLGKSVHKWPATYATNPWLFKDPAKTFGQIWKITLNFSTSQFQAEWIFDQNKGVYGRLLPPEGPYGQPYADKVSGAQITAQTIVVMTVAHSANPPYAGTGKESEWTMSTIGSGAVSVFQDGNRIDGTWKKSSRTDRTRFYDAANTEISLDRGQIWVEVLPQTGTLVASTSPV